MEHAVQPGEHAEHDGDDHDPAAKSAARAQQPAAENDEPSRAHHTEASLNAIIDGINRAKYLFRQERAPPKKQDPILPYYQLTSYPFFLKIAIFIISGYV